MENLYYQAPPDEIFDEVKAMAMELWKIVDTDNDKYRYASEKIARIKDLKNVDDNVMYIVAMFDMDNQRLLGQKLSYDARYALKLRMLAGGAPSRLIPF